MYKIILTTAFLNDVRSISAYIEADNPIAAYEVVNNIYDTITMLEIFPAMWQKVKWNLRHWIDTKYRYEITYSVNWKRVIILSVTKYQKKV